MQKFSKSQNKDEQKNAEEIDKKLQPVHKSLFIESNPSPVKYAAKLIGLCDDNVRLPLVTVLDETKAEVKKALISAELINCLLYTSPSPRDRTRSRMPSSA